MILFVPCSGLVVWCSQEVKHLTSHLAKQLFMPQVTLSTLVECIVTVRSHCDQVYALKIYMFQRNGIYLVIHGDKIFDAFILQI